MKLTKVLTDLISGAEHGKARKRQLSGGLVLKYVHGNDHSVLKLARRDGDPDRQAVRLNPNQSSMPTPAEVAIVKRDLVASADRPIHDIYQMEERSEQGWCWISLCVVWGKQARLFA